MNGTNFALVIEDSRSMRDYVSLILKQDAHIDHIIEAEESMGSDSIDQRYIWQPWPN